MIATRREFSYPNIKFFLQIIKKNSLFKGTSYFLSLQGCSSSHLALLYFIAIRLHKVFLMFLSFWFMILIYLDTVLFFYFYLIHFFTVPNKTWYINLFLLVNETCVTLIFSTSIIFSVLDKLSKKKKN